MLWEDAMLLPFSLRPSLSHFKGVHPSKVAKWQNGLHLQSWKPRKDIWWTYIPGQISDTCRIYVRTMSDIVRIYIRHVSDISPGIYVRLIFLAFQLRSLWLGPIIKENVKCSDRGVWSVTSLPLWYFDRPTTRLTNRYTGKRACRKFCLFIYLNIFSEARKWQKQTHQRLKSSCVYFSAWLWSLIKTSLTFIKRMFLQLLGGEGGIR